VPKLFDSLEPWEGRSENSDTRSKIAGQLNNYQIPKYKQHANYMYNRPWETGDKSWSFLRVNRFKDISIISQLPVNPAIGRVYM
jgi:hypothetical protein